MYPGERTGAHDGTILAGSPDMDGFAFYYSHPNVFDGRDFHQDFSVFELSGATLTMAPGDVIWFLDQGTDLLGDDDEIKRAFWIVQATGGEVAVADGWNDGDDITVWADQTLKGTVGNDRFYSMSPEFVNHEHIYFGLGVKLTCTSGNPVITFVGVQIEGADGYLIPADGEFTWSEERPATTGPYDVGASAGAVGVPTEVGLLRGYGREWTGSHPSDIEAAWDQALAARDAGDTDTSEPFGVYHQSVSGSGAVLAEVTDVGSHWGATIFEGIWRATAATTDNAYINFNTVQNALFAAGLRAGRDYLDWAWSSEDFGIDHWSLDLRIRVADHGFGDPPFVGGPIDLIHVGGPMPTFAPASGPTVASVTATAPSEYIPVATDIASSDNALTILLRDEAYTLIDGTTPARAGSMIEAAEDAYFLAGFIAHFRQPAWRYKIPVFVPGPTLAGILPLRQYPRNDGLRGGAPSARATSRQGSIARRTYL